MKKPKIVIYYHANRGRNDGPPLYWFNAMKNLGLNVVHTMPEGDTRRFNGPADYHFCVDYGEDALGIPEWYPPQDGGKTIYIASDTHLDNGYRLIKATHFDFAFFNQKDAFLKFDNELNKSKVMKSMWLTHAAEPQAFPKYDLLKKYDVCFIGHFQDVKNYNGITRIDMLDRAFKEFPNFYFGTRTPADPSKNMFEDASRKFSMSKVVLNISIKDDINMRVFEILSSGSFQLTNWIPTLGELFEDGKHLVTYKTLDEMVEKARYYIEHEEEREKIAQAGHEEFMNHHTYKHRVLRVLEMIGYPMETISL